MDRERKQRGYTLVELLAVCTIISILAAISFALFSRMRSQAIETNALAAMNSMATGYEMYYFSNMSYPQWGEGQEFSSQSALIDHMIYEEYLPRSWSNYHVSPATGYLVGITQDYAVEIIGYDPGDPTTSEKNSYFIVFHPYNFQKDALAIGVNPPTGWVAVRPRRGPASDQEGNLYRGYQLYVFKRGGAGI